MTDFALKEAIWLLQKASCESGFIASSAGKDNYDRVWTRDGVVCGLAALTTDSNTLMKTFKQTLETIYEFQHLTGYFPSNVIPNTNKVSYGGAVGRVDNPSWAIIGLCSYLKKIKDEDFKNRLKEKVIKGFWVMDAWEFNGKNLMYVPLSGDWADEYCQHGYILFDQLLRVWALELAAEIYENIDWKNKASLIRQTIEKNYHKQNIGEKVYWPMLLREKNKFPKNFWLMGFNPAEIYPQFDLQANALALYLNLGSVEIQENLLQYLADWQSKIRGLIPSFSPTIIENDDKMKLLANNYAYQFRNKPHTFHNGGLWPVWNGFLLACMKNKKQEVEQRIYQALVQACRHSLNPENKYEFNECLHGQTSEPNGLPFCSWSAAGLILANNGFYEN